MDAHAGAARRPRRLVWITLALAGATLGLALRHLSPALTPAGVTHVPLWFDAAFGAGGAAGLLWAARRLWREYQRDSRAAGFILLCWAVLATGITVRAALYAQADYERGRLPFFAAATAALFAASGAMRLIAARRRTPAARR